MALDFPNSPADRDIHVDRLNQRWQYDSTWNSWTMLSGSTGFPGTGYTGTGYTGTVSTGTQTLTFTNGVLTSVV